METFLLIVLIAVLVIRWAVLSNRYAEMERRIEALRREQIDPREITSLIKRITRLEQSVVETKGAAVPTPEARPAPEPVRVPVVPPATLPPVVKEPPVIKEPPPPAAAPLPPPPPPRPSGPPPFVEPAPARPSRTSAEWEALVGGNWLNKLGVLVLVIAIALFLGYEFPRLGPGGISAISLAISFALLAGGAITERRAHYVIFGRGLLAGGWAGLYFTTYAMQSLEAARVIHSPVLGAVLLLAVSTGMVVHSLRYREPVLTGFAYFMCFFTLAITRVTALSVIALIPLAGSLLFIAYQFEWNAMALFAMAATYATCATKPDTGAPLWQAQTVFTAYWLLFEAYDLLRAHRRSDHVAEQAMLPFNALGFGMLSYVKWTHAAPDDLYLLTIGVAALYLAATVLRAVLRPPASFDAEAGTWSRILAGGFEGPITLAATASAAAAVLKLHGQTVNNVLLAEGELLFLAGLFFRQNYPRRLAGVLFAALGVKLLVTDIPSAGTVTVAGRALRDWTPSAALAALLFYANRGLRKVGLSYGYCASALVALILGFEMPLRYLGIGWLVLGATLFTLGWTWRLADFRLQGYLTGMLAAGGIAYYQIAILEGAAQPFAHPWISLACSAAGAYAAVLCALRSAQDRLSGPERAQVRFTASAVASAASMALLWKVVPAVYLGPAWLALSLVLLEFGLRRWPREFRWQAYLIGAAGVANTLLFTVLPFHPLTVTADRVAVGATALLAYLFAARIFTAGRSEAPEAERATAAASTCGSFLVLVELWALIDPVWVAPVWAIFALLLTSVGVRFGIASLRLQGHAVALAAMGRLLAVNFDAAYRVPASAIVVAAHYLESWRQRRTGSRLAAWERALDRPYLYTAAGLLAVLLYRQLPAPYIETGWALLALALLAAGRIFDLRDVRYQSYALGALVCARALVLEFPPSTIFDGTEQRIVAGATVAACLFAAQFLRPKGQYSRLYYSLLATVLVTALLFQEVSGSMLTVAWGIEGAALFALGFPLRDRTFRLSGMALFLVCVGKLFAYDLRALETLYRILSFFVLGVILVAVSWLYTRFRDRIQRYL